MRSHPHTGAQRGRGRRDEGFGPGPFGPGPFGHGFGPGGPGFGPGGPGFGPEGPGGGRGRRRGRGFSRPGGWQQGDLPSTHDLHDWLTGRLPKEWFTGLDVTADREEITIIGTLNEEPANGPEAEGLISRWRADTKSARIAVAEEAEARYGRKVAWGARLGDTEVLFTHLTVPVMTRLRQPERQILDTLVDAGVARSRSDALAWCVRLTGEHTQDWLGQLRAAMAAVDELRSEGPSL